MGNDPDELAQMKEKLKIKESFEYYYTSAQFRKQTAFKGQC
jgi:hypothetical protein